MVSLLKERHRKCAENTETCNKTYSRLKDMTDTERLKMQIYPEGKECMPLTLVIKVDLNTDVS